MNNLVRAICGVAFIAKRSDAKYCSEKCKTRSETIQRQEKISENRQPVIKNCKVCGDEFQANIRTPYQIYCSETCLRVAMHRRQVENGTYCESQKKTRQKHKQKYKKLNDDYKDQIRFGGNKKRVLERDGYKCVECGKIKGLTVHHKDHSGNGENPNNDMDNLITLCRSCHMRHHASGENNYLYKHITKEQIIEVRKASTSWEEVAKKLGVNRILLYKRRRQYGIY